MDKARKDAFRVNFDRRFKLEFHEAKVTSDDGLLVYREPDDVLGLTEMVSPELTDTRTGKNTQHKLIDLVRQSIYSRLAGYEDTNDAERLCIDPAIRHLIGGRAKERRAASTSQMGRFETEILTQTKNLELLIDLPREWVDRIYEHKPAKMIILDMDSSDVWELVLKPVVERYSLYDFLNFFRGDAAFALPGLYNYLEAENYYYAIRLNGNDILYEKIDHLLTRPVGRPSHQPKVFYESFYYQAKTWDKPRLVVAKVEWHADELFPRVAFIVTNLRWKSKNVVSFYNKRGTAEQWIKGGKYAFNWTRLSCHDFVDNQVGLQLFCLAYNLGNFLRRLALPRKVSYWSPTTLREKLVKIGAKVVKHSRHVIFQMAEVAMPRALFKAILERIGRLWLPPPLVKTV